jgi:hypothetical protein
VVVPPVASPSAATSLVVAVDRINKFIIDDTVRGPDVGLAYGLVVRSRSMSIPRAI